MLEGKVLRVARPTDCLDLVVRFYTQGLGLQILDRFENHEGFDGVMVGMPGENHHFEFTHHRGHTVGRAPTQDNLTVFYLPNQQEWQQAALANESNWMRACPLLQLLLGQRWIDF